MPTIIDALIVTLNLDASNFTTGQKQAVEHLRQTEEQAGRTARELSTRGRQGAEFFDTMKTSALSFLGVFVGVGGLENIIKSTTQSMADLGRQATNIGVDVSTLDAYGMAIKRNVGGNAEAARASLLTLAQTMEMYRLKGDSPIARWLSRIGAGRDDSAMTVVEKFTRFAEANKEDVQGINAVGLGLGLNQDQINEARRGTNQFQRDMAESRRLGTVTPEMTKNAQDFWEALIGTSQAISHIKDVMVDEWGPTLTTLLNIIKEWVLANPELAKNILEVASAFVVVGTALTTMRLAAKLLGLGGAVSEVGAAFEGTAGILGRLLPLFARLTPALAVLYEMWPKSTATEDQERELQNQARIAHGEEPIAKPEATTNPPSAFGKWARGVVGGMPEGPAKDWARAHFGTDEIADASMSGTQKAFLQTIDAKESGGDYAIREGGKTRITDFSQFPEGRGEGGRSSATGRYQFTRDTWNEVAGIMHLPDFSPVSQDRAAWFLAEREYRNKTGGRNLETDFASGNYSDEIAKALSGRWSSLPYGQEPRMDVAQLAAMSRANLEKNRPIPTSGATPTPYAPPRFMVPTETPITPRASIFQGYNIPPGSLPNVSPGDRPSTQAAVAQGATTPPPTSNTSTSEMHVGNINIHTQATDPDGIAKGIAQSLSDLYVGQANRGLQ